MVRPLINMEGKDGEVQYHFEQITDSYAIVTIKLRGMHSRKEIWKKLED